MKGNIRRVVASAQTFKQKSSIIMPMSEKVPDGKKIRLTSLSSSAG
jgi:hypothetical protein